MGPLRGLVGGRWRGVKLSGHRGKAAGSRVRQWPWVQICLGHHGFLESLRSEDSSVMELLCVGEGKRAVFIVTVYWWESRAGQTCSRLESETV